MKITEQKLKELIKKVYKEMLNESIKEMSGSFMVGIVHYITEEDFDIRLFNGKLSDAVAKYLYRDKKENIMKENDIKTIEEFFKNAKDRNGNDWDYIKIYTMNGKQVF